MLKWLFRFQARLGDNIYTQDVYTKYKLKQSTIKEQIIDLGFPPKATCVKIFSIKKDGSETLVDTKYF